MIVEGFREVMSKLLILVKTVDFRELLAFLTKLSKTVSRDATKLHFSHFRLHKIPDFHCFLPVPNPIKPRDSQYFSEFLSILEKQSKSVSEDATI